MISINVLDILRFSMLCNVQDKGLSGILVILVTHVGYCVAVLQQAHCVECPCPNNQASGKCDSLVSATYRGDCECRHSCSGPKATNTHLHMFDCWLQDSKASSFGGFLFSWIERFVQTNLSTTLFSTGKCHKLLRGSVVLCLFIYPC